MIVSELIALLQAKPQDAECMIYFEDAQEFRPIEVKDQLLVDSNSNSEYTDRDSEAYSKLIAFTDPWAIANKQAYTEYINALKSRPSKTVILFKPEGGQYLPAPPPPEPV